MKWVVFIALAVATAGCGGGARRGGPWAGVEFCDAGTAARDIIDQMTSTAVRAAAPLSVAGA